MTPAINIISCLLAPRIAMALMAVSASPIPFNRRSQDNQGNTLELALEMTLGVTPSMLRVGGFSHQRFLAQDQFAGGKMGQTHVIVLCRPWHPCPAKASLDRFGVPGPSRNFDGGRTHLQVFQSPGLQLLSLNLGRRGVSGWSVFEGNVVNMIVGCGVEVVVDCSYSFGNQRASRAASRTNRGPLRFSG